VPQHLMFVLLMVTAVGYAVPLGQSDVVGVKRVLTQMLVTGRLEWICSHETLLVKSPKPA